MQLPSPSEQDIAAFRILYLRKTGKEISGEAARQMATHLLRFIYLTHYEIHTIQSKK